MLKVSNPLPFSREERAGGKFAGGIARRVEKEVL